VKSEITAKPSEFIYQSTKFAKARSPH